MWFLIRPLTTLTPFLDDGVGKARGEFEQTVDITTVLIGFPGYGVVTVVDGNPMRVRDPRSAGPVTVIRVKPVYP